MKAFAQYSFFFLLFLAITPAARASFSIMPMETQQRMTVGETRLTDEIEVYNSGNEPLHVSASAVAWKLTSGGEYEYSEAGTEPLSCANWIQLSPAQFNVLPQKSVRVRYTITAPQNFTNEHRAMIFFTSRPLPVKAGNGMGVMIATRMGCKLFISPAQPLSRVGRITDMELQGSAKSRARVSVQNTAAATFRAKGTLQVHSEDGTLVTQAQSNSAQVLPGASRDLWFELSTPLPAGNYMLKVVVDYGTNQLLGGELKAKVTASESDLGASNAAVNPHEVESSKSSPTSITASTTTSPSVAGK
jgi:P pilus assembly chaperone PapD